MEGLQILAYALQLTRPTRCFEMFVPNKYLKDNYTGTIRRNKMSRDASTSRDQGEHVITTKPQWCAHRRTLTNGTFSIVPVVMNMVQIFFTKNVITVTVIKSQGKAYLIGGYTPLSWTSQPGNLYDNQAQSFVFSLGSNNILSRIKDITQGAILGDQYRGPVFGGGHDLCIEGNCDNNNSSYSRKYSYEYALPNSDNFRVGDYEVFQIQ